MKVFKDNKIRYSLVILTALAVIAGVVYFVFFRAKSAEAEWFNDSWFYRKKVEITNAGTAQTDFQVMITLDTAALYSASKIQSDCDDIRITDITGKLLPHWLEPGTCNNASTKIWTKVPSIATTGATIYLYYGNPSATSVSSTTSTFIREISNVQGAWSMDEVSWTNDCSASTVLDSSNNANHGKSCPAGTGPTGGAAGKFGNAGSFDGTNDYASVSAAANLRTSTFSGAFWIKRNGLPLIDYGHPLSLYTGNGWIIYMWKVNSSIQLNMNPGSQYFNFGDLSDGVWTHIAWTYNSGTGALNLYKNGGNVLSTTFAGYIPVAAGQYLNMGKANWYDGEYFPGVLDDVRLYDKVLSTAEISDLYGTGGDRQGYTTTNYPNVELVRKYSASVSVGSAGTEQQGPGPVAHWRFDEGTGDTTYDDSPNNNDGTRGGGTADYKPTWQAEDMCVSGKCLKFDGVNDYVAAGNGASVNFGTGDFTLEAWAKDIDDLERKIINKRSGAAAGYEFGIRSGKIAAFISDGSNFVENYGDTAVTNNAWHHLVVGFDRSAKLFRFYLDGRADGTQSFSTVTGPTDNALNLWIGIYRNGTSSQWNSFIDNVKVYSYLRTAAQIKADYLAGMRGGGEAAVTLGATNQKYLSDGLVGYWKMDEASWTNDCSTSTVTDSSGTGNNGKSCPAGTGPTGAAAGKFGNAGYFDGSDDGIHATSYFGDVSMDTQTYCITFWMKAPSTAGSWYVPIGIKPTTSSNVGIQIWVDPNNKLAWAYEYADGSSPKNRGGFDIVVANNTWKHIAMCSNTVSSLAAYVNGAAVSSMANTGSDPWTAGTNLIFIGDPVSTARKYKGTLDEVRIYNRVLSPKEVRDLYNFAPGPVGHWKMDEASWNGTSGEVKDSSTYGNNGTSSSGATTYSPGKYGKAGTFDGNDDYVDLGTSNTLLPAITDNLTMEAWIYPTTSQGHIIRLRRRAYMAFYNNKIDYAWRTAAGVANEYMDASLTISQNVWTHVVIVKNGLDIKFYINGVLNSYSPTQVNDPGYDGYANSDLGGGVTPDLGTSRFTGLIDDVRIYNYARTQKQILEDMNAGHPAVGSPVGSYAAYWKFDEGYSNIAYDMSGNNNDGTLYPGAGGGNTQAYQMWDNNGKFGKAIEFDGTDDYVEVSDSSTLDITNAITISAWVKKTTDTSWKVLIDKEYSTAWGWYLHGDGQMEIDAYIGGVYRNQWVMAAANTFSRDIWQHVAWTYDSTTARIYVNGINKTITQSATGVLGTNATNLRIGLRSPDNYGPFNGLIDEVKIYPFALTEDEIRTEYNRGTAIKLGSVSTASDGATASDAASRGYCVPGDATSCNAPVAEWKMDEYTGTSAQDTSGNGNTGTITNATWTTGKYGSALNFDGSGDVVEIGAAKFDSLTNATVELWFYYTGSFDTDRVFFNRYKDNSNRMPMFISYSGSYGNKIVYENIVGGGGGNAISDNTISANIWYHVAATCGTGGMKMYVNGQLQANGDVTTDCFSAIAATTSNSIGASNSAYYFQGKIDDVRIYDYARTPAQIAWDYNQGKPVAHWKFDECQGSTVYDMSDNNNDGTIYIGGSGDQDGIGTCTDGDTTNAWYNGRAGKYNSAMSFDGTDDYVRGPNSTSLRLAQNDSSYSIAVWLKADSLTGNPVIIGKPDTASPCGYFYGIWLSSAGIIYTNAHSSLYEVHYRTTAAQISTGQWYHIIWTFNRPALTTTIYVNGASKALTASEIAYAGSDTYLKIGVHNYQNQSWFNGLIDEVKIYNYALTTDQVQTAYNQGAAVRFGPSTGSP